LLPHAADLETAGVSKITRGPSGQGTCTRSDLAVAENTTRLAKECGDIDILINNARCDTAGRDSRISMTRPGARLGAQDVGYVNLTREVYRGMCERRRGVIVNVIGRRRRAPDRPATSPAALPTRPMTMSARSGAESPKFRRRVLGLNPSANRHHRGSCRWRTRRRRNWDAERWNS